MTWNLVASTLLTGATTCTYDGSPAPFAVLWEPAARHRVTVFGTSPQYLLGMAKYGIDPSAHDLSSIRVVGCTGSALPASGYPWVRHHVGDHVLLASISGGTDVVSGFAGSAPSTPVWAGELSAPHLGVALAAYDAEGLPIVDQVGELVVTRPLPSMPLYFWNDPDGTRYRDASFSSHPGVWRHGDGITLTSHGSVIVHGRSDSTLNRVGPVDARGLTGLPPAARGNAAVESSTAPATDRQNSARAQRKPTTCVAVADRAGVPALRPAGLLAGLADLVAGAAAHGQHRFPRSPEVGVEVRRDLRSPDRPRSPPHPHTKGRGHGHTARTRDLAAACTYLAGED